VSVSIVKAKILQEPVHLWDSVRRRLRCAEQLRARGQVTLAGIGTGHEVCALTVGTDGIIREVAVTWGTSASAWTNTVTYSRLGETPPPVAPANARDLLRDRFGGGQLSCPRYPRPRQLALRRGKSSGV
jgi:hypothetical protein